MTSDLSRWSGDTTSDLSKWSGDTTSSLSKWSHASMSVWYDFSVREEIVLDGHDFD